MNKTITALVFALAASSATTAVVAADNRPAFADPRGGQDLLAKRPDHTHRGLRHRVRRIFEALDLDENGVITLDEFLVKTLEKAALQFERIDADEDGLISRAEWSEVGSNRPPRADIDLEGVHACITDRVDEEVAHRPDRDSRFDEIDTNDDGFIDLDEFLAVKEASATDKFNRIDTDDDAAISPQERAKALLAMHKRRETRRECIAEQRDMDELLTE